MITKEAKVRALKEGLKEKKAFLDGLGAAYLLDGPKKLTDKTASVELINPRTLIAMRDEFQSIYDKEAEQVEVKLAKVRLEEIINERFPR